MDITYALSCQIMNIMCNETKLFQDEISERMNSSEEATTLAYQALYLMQLLAGKETTLSCTVDRILRSKRLMNALPLREVRFALYNDLSNLHDKALRSIYKSVSVFANDTPQTAANYSSAVVHKELDIQAAVNLKSLRSTCLSL